ncbi:MAG: DUF4209 domain-containing protein [Candidatus Micrarchaeia archaeon]|jgi:hypothetical protein
MDTYNPKELTKKIEKILNQEYEREYPYEIEKELNNLVKIAIENNDEDNKTKILWEIDLLNRVIGHSGLYNGKEVSEISNKWKYYLENKEFKPFSNPPFCEWSSEAIDYYKIRFDKTNSSLSKARYAFAIMVFSHDKNRVEWVKKSIENWKKTAEKYVNNGKYAEFYEIPPFAYDFALGLCTSFSLEELFKEVFLSIHNSIIEIINNGENRWQLEFFIVEIKYLNKIDDETINKESTSQIKNIISEIKSRTYSQSKFHFLRTYLDLLTNYICGTEEIYEINKEIAESFILESEGQTDFGLKVSLYVQSVKKYKQMQSMFNNHLEIKKRIETLTQSINEFKKYVKYKTISAKLNLPNEEIETYFQLLKTKNEDPIKLLLSDLYFIPNYELFKTNTVKQKEEGGLLFILPVVIHRNGLPVIQYTNEEEIFKYKVRSNIQFALKLGAFMLNEILSKIEKEGSVNTYNYLIELVNSKELEDIKPTLKYGFEYIFIEPKNSIAGLHIIIPYFEEIIRRIIIKSGKVDLVLESHKEKYFRKIELGTLLVDENVKNIIGEDFQKSLKVLLTDTDQMNMRNDLLHGLVASNKITESETKFFGFCLLKLIKILHEMPDSNIQNCQHKDDNNEKSDN